MMIKPQAATLALALLATGAAQADRTLFRFNGLDYQDSDLSVEFQQTLYELDSDHHRRTEKLLEGAMLEAYFNDAAKKQGKPVHELMVAALAAPTPDAAAVKAFYEENKAKISGDFEQVKPQLERYLQNKAQEERRAALTEEIKKKHNFELLLPAPESLPVTIDTLNYPMRGNPDAKVHIVEFADYQCPHCKHADEALLKVLDQYQGKINWTYMDMPVNQSGISRQVAEGAVCAEKQGKFWEYHELAFARQDNLTQDSPLALAKELKLDEAAFTACLQTPEAKDRVARAKAEGQRLGITGTPAIFVNGRRVHLYDLDRDLREAVEQAEKTAAK